MVYVLPYQLGLILHQFARCPPGLNVAQFSCDTFCLLLFPCHVLHAVARATLWRHLFEEKWGCSSHVQVPPGRISGAVTNLSWCQFRHSVFQQVVKVCGLNPATPFAVGCFMLSLSLFLHSQGKNLNTIHGRVFCWEHWDPFSQNISGQIPDLSMPQFPM